LIGDAFVVLAAGLLLAAVLGALAKLARGEKLIFWWPGWLGGATMIAAVYGLAGYAMSIASNSDDLVHVGPVTVNVLSLTFYAASVMLLALVAPFGGYRRTDALRSLVPVLGLIWILPVVWESGVGLAVFGNWGGIAERELDSATFIER